MILLALPVCNNGCYHDLLAADSAYLQLTVLKEAFGFIQDILQRHECHEAPIPTALMERLL